MKCSGIKCVTPINPPNPMADFALQLPGSIPTTLPPFNFPRPSPTELDAYMQPPAVMPRPPFDNFVFKQINRLGNLRGR